ncbi:MAG: hypothetical protein GXY83_35245 [Rhodopirellula sp.]|nr:hypothetical protein [Rhodopirellula sp.]
MQPQQLIDTAMAQGLPAPYWFIELFKVLGFSLHAVPMNLWYAGILIAMLLRAFGSEQGKRFSERLMLQMPVIIAFGVNLGIVPLLFIQVAYAKVFYPATVLMAWAWLGIIVLLIPAYYGVYIYAFGLRDREKAMPAWKQAAGWVAAILFIAIGFTFANGLSLMANVEAWPQLFRNHNVAAAATGTALNTADPSLWPRWLMMFGLAITTTAAWVLFDAGWFAVRESREYHRWAPRFALALYSVGLAWFAVAGSWYVFGTWSSETQQQMLYRFPMVLLTAATALAPGLPWLLILWIRRQDTSIGPWFATLAVLGQFGVLGINAISRQIVQNIELSGFYRPGELPLDVQWSPLVLFLVTFVAGLGLVVWMIRQVAIASPTETV